MNEVGTLKELSVQVGDVVECVYTCGMTWWTKGKHYTITSDGTPFDDCGSSYGRYDDPQPAVTFRIISRANQPKLWRDMTPEEKGALLLARHEGKVIEWSYGLPWITERSTETGHYPTWSDTCAYRVRTKTEPKVETVTQHWKTNKKGEFVPMNQYDKPHDSTHRITFTTIDGKPDCASIKMEEV